MSSPREISSSTRAQDGPRRSRRACNNPTGNGTGDWAPIGYKGCAVCHNDDHYGFGTSVCGRCNRCHGCGSSNNGIGPIQAVYFGGKAVAKKALAGLGSKSKDGEAGGGGSGGVKEKQTVEE